jgi:alkylhydroperoxidase family enzyme
VLADYRIANISEKDRALFAFIDRLNREPSAIRHEDADALRAAGWTDEAIYDAVSVCALFNFYNRWIDGTGVSDLPAAGYAMSGKRIAENGYAR